MANILFTWEMGANLGHLARLRPMIRQAQQQGHTLSVALRNLRYAGQVLAGLDFRCFQAPHRHALNPRPAQQSLSHAHTLEDFCFSDSGELGSYISAWREIFAATSPDVVVYDTSPGALIASHGSRFGKIITGNGFFLPPTAPIEGVFAPFITTQRDQGTLEKLRRNDRRLLKVLNNACQSSKLPVFDRLAGIYSQADIAFYTTFPELDQFGARAGVHYLGTQPSFGGASLPWPGGGEDKVFCYLQNFPGIDTLLQELCAQGLKLLVYSRDLPPEMYRRLGEAGNIAFSSEPVCLEAVSRLSSFVVHHASAATAGQFLLYGVPQLCVPTKQDQLLTAMQLDRAGVGFTALHNQRSFAADIRQIHQRASFRERALHFRQHYADFNWQESEKWMGLQLQELLAEVATR